MSLHLREYEDSDYVPVQRAYTLDDGRSYFLRERAGCPVLLDS